MNKTSVTGLTNCSYRAEIRRRLIDAAVAAAENDSSAMPAYSAKSLCEKRAIAQSFIEDVSKQDEFRLILSSREEKEMITQSVVVALTQRSDALKANAASEALAG